MTNLGVGGEGGFWDGVDPAALAVPSVVDGEHVEAAPLEDLVQGAAATREQGSVDSKVRIPPQELFLPG